MRFFIAITLVAMFTVACNKDSNRSSGGGTGMDKQEQTSEGGGGSASDANTQPTDNTETQQ